MRVEAWSVLARSENTADTSKEVVNKMVEQMGPTLGVRVHGIMPACGGGAVVRTPSAAEREKILANAKFVEIGFDVAGVKK